MSTLRVYKILSVLIGFASFWLFLGGFIFAALNEQKNASFCLVMFLLAAALSYMCNELSKAKNWVGAE